MFLWYIVLMGSKRLNMVGKVCIFDVLRVEWIYMLGEIYIFDLLGRGYWFNRYGLFFGRFGRFFC